MTTLRILGLLYAFALTCIVSAPIRAHAFIGPNFTDDATARAQPDLEALWSDDVP